MALRWLAPLDRREITLLLFSLTIFIFSYNIDSSLHLLGFNPSSTVFSRILGFSPPFISADGRRPLAWRDKLEREVFGDFSWERGQVANYERHRSRSKGESRFGATWLGLAETGVVAGDVFGHESVNNAIQWWGNDAPRTNVLQHMPGFTIIDSAILMNGTMYLVTDETSFPSPNTIASWQGNSDDELQVTDWQVINSEWARNLLGESGGMIHGVTWMSTDTTLHPTTILALHRLHSSISRTSKKLRNPQRLLLPHISTFLPLAPHQPHTTPRIRTPLPLPLHHPFLLKSAFPAVGVEYKEDWDDYCLMEMPWVFERLVLVDQGAARRAAGTEGLHAVLRLDERSDWWTPIRATLLRSLSLPVDTPPEGAKPVVTYISRQNATAGPKLRGADHTALLQALKRERLEVIVVEDGDSVGEKAGGVWTDEGKRWDALSRAVIRSNIVLGVHGAHMLSSAFMPSARSTVMEFFPEATFTRDQEAVISALGLNYLAWRGNQKFNGSSLPSIAPPPPSTSATQEVPVDVQAIVRVVRETLAR